jgi:hypothetical protein
LVKIDQRVLDWLLEPNQPAVRYRAMICLLDRSERDSDVRQTYATIPKRGWAHDILKEQNKKGYWESEKSLYRPKYIATNWRVIVLSDLGLRATNQKIKNAANLIFKYWLSLPSRENVFNEEVCIVGNTARTLTRFGYEDDFRVRKLFDRLVEDQKEDGGWHCFQSTRGTLDGWEGMAAFAALPRAKRTRGIKNAIERGAEFYLERKLFKEGERYAPWFKFHYPVHYYYDILVGLDMITALGYAGEKRLKSALEILKQKRLQNGEWKLDAVHPDLGRGASYRLARKPHVFALEKVGEPSKWITLTALQILKRVEEST